MTFHVHEEGDDKPAHVTIQSTRAPYPQFVKDPVGGHMFHMEHPLPLHVFTTIKLSKVLNKPNKGQELTNPLTCGITSSPTQR